MRTAAAAGQCLRLTLLGTGAMAMSGAGGEAPPAYRYNLAMVTVLQNEAPFLPEWLEYHALYTVGVEHFYLYDDGSTDELAATLAPYLAAGLATLTNVSSLSPLPTSMEVPFERTPALPVPRPLTLSLTKTNVTRAVPRSRLMRAEACTRGSKRTRCPGGSMPVAGACEGCPSRSRRPEPSP